jgi:hypothetical protein
MTRLLVPHPAPVEARLLREAGLRAPLTVPPLMGAALPAVLPQAASASTLMLAIARAVNPRPDRLESMPVRAVDQGDTQCCISCSLTGALESLGKEQQALSQMFHYHVTRRKPGGAMPDGQLVLSSAIGTVLNVGICRDALHPSVFTAGGADRVVSGEAVNEAKTRRLRPTILGQPSPVRHLTGTARSASVREEIRKRHPVVVLFTLPLGYPDAKAFLNDDHEWCDERTPPPSGTRHCVLVVGFDDSRCGNAGAVEIFDSQGSQRFDGGRWWMGYRVLESAQVHAIVAFG